MRKNELPRRIQIGESRKAGGGNQLACCDDAPLGKAIRERATQWATQCHAQALTENRAPDGGIRTGQFEGHNRLDHSRGKERGKREQRSCEQNPKGADRKGTKRSGIRLRHRPSVSCSATRRAPPLAYPSRPAYPA